MRIKKQYFPIYLMLILSMVLFSSCGNGAASEKAMADNDQIMKAFESINQSIFRIDELKEGKLTAEYTGNYMPGTVIKTEMTFKRTEEGLRCTIKDTHEKGISYTYNRESQDEKLSYVASSMSYPKEEIPKEAADKIGKLTVSQNDQGTTYRIDWIPEKNESAKTKFQQELFAAYIIDNNGYLTDITLSTKSYLKKSEEEKPDETINTLKIKLADYSN